MLTPPTTHLCLDLAAGTDLQPDLESLSIITVAELRKHLSKTFQCYTLVQGPSLKVPFEKSCNVNRVITHVADQGSLL